MTETLAKVYLQQKKFKRPYMSDIKFEISEKNSFADQIKKIKHLQQNKV